MKVSVSDSEYNQPSGLQEKLERLNHMMSAGGGEMEGTNYRRMQYLSSEYRNSVWECDMEAVMLWLIKINGHWTQDLRLTTRDLHLDRLLTTRPG